MRELVKRRKQNMKIYSLYRMLSADHLFLYAVDFIFLTQIKNISAADIVFGQAFFALSAILFQIFAIFIIDKIGKRMAVSVANIFLAIHVLLIINCNKLSILLLAQFVDAIGFAIKDIADTSLLNASIPKSQSKGEIFSQIEGRGSKNFYYFSAVSAIIAGLLYEINAYIPLVFSLLASVLSAIIALGFEDIKEDGKNEKKKISDYIIDLKESFKFIFKSERLKALLLYSGIFTGVFFLMNTYILSLLEELGAVAIVIAIFTFLKSLAGGIGSNKQLNFHNKFKNTSLSKILLTTLMCICVIGVLGLIKLNLNLAILLVSIISLLIYFMKGLQDVLIIRYLQNFTNEEILSRIYAVNSFTRNAFRILLSLVGSYFLRITNTANSIILLGMFFAIIVLILIFYMKKRVGLNPDEYEENEIKFDI